MWPSLPIALKPQFLLSNTDYFIQVKTYAFMKTGSREGGHINNTDNMDIMDSEKPSINVEV